MRNSDTGEAAVIEGKREEAELSDNISANESENERIAAARKQRLAAEAKERSTRIEVELAESARLEAERQRQVEEVIMAETEALSKRIHREDVERAIEQAIANPVDYEFCIDLEGNAYRWEIRQPGCHII
jgi:small subunit ribosomal protein S26